MVFERRSRALLPKSLAMGAGRRREAQEDLSTVALRDVSIEVDEGELVSFVGESGCGKSTLLKAIGGIIKPTSGSISIRGTTPEESQEKRQFGFVFQDSVLLPWRTAIENVALPLEVMGVQREERLRQAEELLKLVKLESFRDHHPHQLSGGMQQRVSIIRALSFKPSILLMDEMFSRLDGLTKRRLIGFFLALWEREGRTGVFVTHDVDEAILLSDRVAVMTPRPGTIKEVIQIKLPRPRKLDVYGTPEFVAYRERLIGSLEESAVAQAF